MTSTVAARSGSGCKHGSAKTKFRSALPRPPSGSYADAEHGTITQVCEMLLHEGIEAYKKEGPKLMQRLVAKPKARVKDPGPSRERRCAY